MIPQLHEQIEQMYDRRTKPLCPTVSFAVPSNCRAFQSPDGIDMVDVHAQVPHSSRVVYSM